MWHSPLKASNGRVPAHSSPTLPVFPSPQGSAPRRAVLGAALAAAATFCGLPAALAAPPAPAVRSPQVKDPLRVLIVGNSYQYYNDSLHNHLRRMIAAAGIAPLDSLQFKSATIGGAALEHHPVDWLTTPGRIGVAQPFELVVLQGGSAEPLGGERARRFVQTVREHDRIIRARGARTALYMTHAYAEPHPQARVQNLRLTEEVYVQAGNEVGALVIPVGLAFEEALRRHPPLRLHKSDGSHPNLLGTYLAACTVLASVYGRSPVGNPYDYEGAVDAATARQLQQVAHDVVQAFQAR